MDRDAAAMDRAARQHGLLTTADALELGLSHNMIGARVAAGQWIRTFPGVYRMRCIRQTWDTRVMAVSLWLGHSGAIAARSALTLYGLDHFRDLAVVDALQTTAKRSLRADVRLIRTQNLGKVRVVRGIRTVAPERALLTAAPLCNRRLLERVVERSFALGLTSPGDLSRFCEQRSRGERGLSALRWAVQRCAGEGRTESELETRCLQAIRNAGLPEPVQQFVVRERGQRLGRVDLAYPGLRIAIEVDGWIWHSSRSSFDRDRARLNSLTAAGWRVLLYTRSTSPARFTTELKELLLGGPLDLDYSHG